MRGWWPVVGGLVLLAAAWSLDRSLVTARMEAGMRPDQFEVFLGADLAARTLFAIIAVGAGWLSLGRPATRGAGVAMLAVGLYFALVETLNFGFFPGVLLLPFAIDASESHLLRWAGTVVALLGLVVAARPAGYRDRRSAAAGSTRPWWPLIGSVTLIAVSYPVGDIVSDARVELATGLTPGPFLIETTVRFATVAALIGIGWLVLHGPRSRVVGALMLAVGAYVAVVVPVAAAWYFMGDPATGDVREPMQIPLGYDLAHPPGGFRSPVSAAVTAVLGLVALIRPNATAAAPVEPQPEVATEAA